MKYSELNDQTVVELTTMSRDKRREIFTLRLQQAGSRLEKPSQLRNLRRDIARIETRISELKKKKSGTAN
jgi:large subunit ribosomal protein L29